jgi:prevent-host-death family protein
MHRAREDGGTIVARVRFSHYLSLAKGYVIAYTPGERGTTMTKTMSLKQARSQFSSLIDKADRLSERFIVTKNGTPKAVVMGAEEYESWVETLELLSNPKAVKALQQGLRDAKAGKVRSFKEVFGEDQ